MFFKAVNPMFVDQHKSRVRPDEAQNWSVQKQLANTPKYSILVQFEGCSRKKGWSSIKHDPTQTNNTLSAVCIEKVVNMMPGEELYAKCISLLSYRKDLYSSRICIMDARILPTLKRVHPSTISAESTGKPVAVESTGRPVAHRLQNPRIATYKCPTTR